MFNKHLILLAVLLCGLMLVVGCAKAPQQAVDAAKAALESAKQAEADRYLPDEFNAAQDSLNAALAEIEKQNSRFALRRNYNRASEMLTSVTNMANDLNAKIAARKDEVRAEAQQLMVDLQSGLKEANALLKKAPKGKEGKEVLQSIQAELATVDSSVGEATTLINNGDFVGAKDKLTAGLAKVNSIKDELKEAIAKYKKAR